MADQDNVRKSAPPRRDSAEVVEEAPAANDSTLAADLDDLLDEIDEVLEENAEEFVRSYVQKGGE